MQIGLVGFNFMLGYRRRILWFRSALNLRLQPLEDLKPPPQEHSVIAAVGVIQFVNELLLLLFREFQQ